MVQAAEIRMERFETRQRRCIALCRALEVRDARRRVKLVSALRERPDAGEVLGMIERTLPLEGRVKLWTALFEDLRNERSRPETKEKKIAGRHHR